MSRAKRSYNTIILFRESAIMVAILLLSSSMIMSRCASYIKEQTFNIYLNIKKIVRYSIANRCKQEGK